VVVINQAEYGKINIKKGHKTSAPEEMPNRLANALNFSRYSIFGQKKPVQYM
jgi:hypothetical protein